MHDGFHDYDIVGSVDAMLSALILFSFILVFNQLVFSSNKFAVNVLCVCVCHCICVCLPNNNVSSVLCMEHGVWEFG